MAFEPPCPQELSERLLRGERGALARSITLVESHRDSDRAAAAQILERVGAAAGNAWRIGVSGVPGVGKSTFLERFGLLLIEQGLRPAVLAIDPSSRLSGGSILGDKARMDALAQHPDAFIRPTPAGTTLGGVARHTRECVTLCEAAGFDAVLIETVGVGQSEVAVAEMVDFFLVLLLAGAGDELQGIKRGILEMADALAVNKADGAHRAAAEQAVREYRNAMQMLRPRSPYWQPPVAAISALEGTGLDQVWQWIQRHREAMQAAGAFDKYRGEQRVRWLWQEIEDGLTTAFRAHPQVAEHLIAYETEVREGRRSPITAARHLLADFSSDRGSAPLPAPPEQ